MNSQESQKQQYLKNYEEFNLLGRGNYGNILFELRRRLSGQEQYRRQQLRGQKDDARGHALKRGA
jgi:hypothetical protein